MRTLLISLIVVVFMPCGVANAATQAEVTAAEVAAVQQWPSGPCKDAQGTLHIDLEVRDAATMDALTGAADTGGAAVQNNVDGACRIYLQRGVFDAGGFNLCTIMVHEYGHLSGANHGDSGMGPYAPTYGPCQTFVPHMTTYQARQDIRARLGAGWHMLCSSSDDGYIGCFVSKHFGKHLRWRSYQVVQSRLGMPPRLNLFAHGIDKF